MSGNNIVTVLLARTLHNENEEKDVLIEVRVTTDFWINQSVKECKIFHICSGFTKDILAVQMMYRWMDSLSGTAKTFIFFNVFYEVIIKFKTILRNYRLIDCHQRSYRDIVLAVDIRANVFIR